MPMTDLRPAGSGLKVLVAACGAANMMNLPRYLIALRALPDCRVHVVMTEAATRLLPVATVRLMSDAVFCDGPDSFDPGHVRLARWPDRLVVLPATANKLGEVANGLGGDLVATLLLAYEGSAIFFPSMNQAMWARPSVRRNVEQLRADGHQVVDPVLGKAWEIASASYRVIAGLPEPETVTRLVAAPGDPAIVRSATS